MTHGKHELGFMVQGFDLGLRERGHDSRERSHGTEGTSLILAAHVDGYISYGVAVLFLPEADSTAIG